MPRAKVKKTQRSVGDFDKTIGNRIRGYRIDRKMSQDDLGNKLGVSFQQVQKYEKGTNRISAARLADIAKLFHTTPHELMGWDGIGVKMTEPVDIESFKLARAFDGLRNELKPAFRALINTIMAEGK
jgi:transcriptional regulator with XRE-family HTH domain